MYPSARPSTSVYLLTKDLATASKIAKHLGIEEHDTVYVAENYKQFIRGEGGRTLYVCGEGHRRHNFYEIVHYARSLKWLVFDGLPPAREKPL